MKSRRTYVLGSVVLAALIIATFAFPWQTLQLSLQTLSVLRAGMPHWRSGTWPSLSPESKLRVCHPDVTAPAVQGQPNEHYRLMRSLYLSCAPSEALVDWIRTTLAQGLVPDEADIVYFSQLLEDSGDAQAALTLRRMNPDTAIWYVNQGELSIRLNQDEAAIERHFQLAQDIDPQLDVRKTHMYLYLCMVDIRDGNSRVIAHPCEDFEKVEQSATSESLFGQKLVLQGKFDKAVGHLLRAIELDRSRPAAYYWAAMALLSLEDHPGARKILQDGYRLATPYPPIALELARLDIAEGCHASAYKILSGLKVIDDPQVANEIASMLDSVAGRDNTSTTCE